MDIDYSLLTSQISFAGLLIALLSVAGVLAGFYVVERSIKLLLGAVQPRDLQTISREEYDEAARLSEESARRWES